MATYRLTIKRDNAQVQLVAKSSALIAYELDRYLENFVNRPISSNSGFEKQNEFVSIRKKTAENRYNDINQGAIKDLSGIPVHTPEEESLKTSSEFQDATASQTPSETINFIDNHEYKTTVEQHEKIGDDSNAQAASREQEALISLADFLMSNKADSTFSEFIISAYYIKRILNISYFTLKMLNSKFYPVTKTLIDLSMVEEARTRGFIELLDEDGVIKYTLTPAGESYFINQLRG